MKMAKVEWLMSKEICYKLVWGSHSFLFENFNSYCEKQKDEQISFQEGLINLDIGMESEITTVKKQTKSYHRYSDEQNLLFVYYSWIKLFNTANSVCLAGGISERTAQKWAKKLKEDKDWNIFEKQTNLVSKPKPQLDDKHKLHLLDVYDNWPQGRIIDFLTQKLSDLGVKKSTVRNLLKTERNLFFKKLTTQLGARNSPTKIQNRKDWVNKWSATDIDYLKNRLVSTWSHLVDRHWKESQLLQTLLPAELFLTLY